MVLDLGRLGASGLVCERFQAPGVDLVDLRLTCGVFLVQIFMMSGLDGSGAVHTVLPWETFSGHVPSGGSEMFQAPGVDSVHLRRSQCVSIDCRFRAKRGYFEVQGLLPESKDQKFLASSVSAFRRPVLTLTTCERGSSPESLTSAPASPAPSLHL